MADHPPFEELYAALEETARRLELGNMPLEDSLKLYEHGAHLVEELRAVLEDAELRVRTLRARLLPAEAGDLAPEGEAAASDEDEGDHLDVDGDD